jgi:hypothetical protein
MKKIILLLILFPLLSCCSALTYSKPDGTTITYMRFLTTTDSISGTVPDATIEVRGQNVNLDALRVVTESAVKAAVK